MIRITQFADVVPPVFVVAKVERETVIVKVTFDLAGVCCLSRVMYLITLFMRVCPSIGGMNTSVLQTSKNGQVRKS